MMYVPVDVIAPMWLQGGRTSEIIIYELLGGKKEENSSTTPTTTTTTTSPSANVPTITSPLGGGNDYSSSSVSEKQMQHEQKQRLLQEDVKLRTLAFTALYKKHDFKACATLISKMDPELLQPASRFSSERMNALCRASPPLLLLLQQQQQQLQHHPAGTSTTQKSDSTKNRIEVAIEVEKKVTAK